MAADEAGKHLPTVIMHSYYQAVGIALNVELGIPVSRLDVRRCLPVRPACLGIPYPQRRFGIPLPKSL